MTEHSHTLALIWAKVSLWAEMKSNHSFWDTVLKVSKSQFPLKLFYAKARFFLLVDLREFFFQIWGRWDRKKEKSSENDQLTDLTFSELFFLLHFQSFF